MAFTVHSTINANTAKNRVFENNNALQLQRRNIFEILQQNQEKLKTLNVPRGHMPSSVITPPIVGEAYSEEMILEKGNKIRRAIQDGYVYTLDTETIGSPKKFNKGIDKNIDKLNNDIFTVTEVALHRQKYEGGRAVGDIEEVFNFSTSRRHVEYEEFIGQSKYIRGKDSTIASNMRRLAGYSDSDSFVTGGKVVKWNDAADFTNEEVIRRGIYNLEQGSTFTVGSDGYIEKVNEVFEEFKKIAQSDNLVLTTVNGDEFDIPVMLEFFRTAGIDIDDATAEMINNGHVDMQKMISQTSREKIYQMQDQRKEQLMLQASRYEKEGRLELAEQLRKEANSIDNSLTNTGMMHAANATGANIKNASTHAATHDAMVTSKSTEALMPVLLDSIGTIEADTMKKVGVSTETAYNAINAVMADPEKDLFFSTDLGGPNTYNPTLMEAGHSYKLSIVSAKDLEVSEELADAYEAIKDKKILVMDDISGKSDRKSFLVLNSDKDIQEKILNTGNVQTTRINKSITSSAVDKTTEAARLDRARVDRQNFYKLNSDKGYSSFEMYFDTFNKYKENSALPTKERLVEEIKSGVLFDFGGEPETLIADGLPKLVSHYEGFEGDTIHERARALLSFYDDFDQNKNTYTNMQKAVNSIVGTKNSFHGKIKIDANSDSMALYNRARTATLATVKKNMNEKLMNSLTDNEILDYIIKNNDNANKALTNVLKEKRRKIAKETGAKVENIELDPNLVSDIKKSIFKKYNGEDFNRNSDIVKNAVFGLESVGDNIKNVSSIDILGYSRDTSSVQLTNSKKIMSDLESSIKSIYAPNKNTTATNRMRLNYLKDVAKDLHKRGLIDDTAYEVINSRDTVKSTISALGDALSSTKNKVDALVAKASKSKDYTNAVLRDSINFSKLDDEEAKFLSNFLGNRRKGEHLVDKNGFTILGKSIDEFVQERFGGFESGFMDDIIESSRGIMPNVLTYSKKSIGSDVVTNGLGRVLKEEYGWSDSNVKRFLKTLDKNSSKDFIYSNGKKVAGGLTHNIVNIDGKGYLITSSKDRDKFIMDKIIEGASIDEIKENAMVFKLPKVEDHHGTKIIRQSEASAKAVTSDIVLEYVKNDSGDYIPKFELEDSVDQVLKKFDRNFKYGVDSMQNRNYQKANSTVNSSWNAIHEEKAVSSIVSRVIDDGKGGVQIKKSLGFNRADHALRTMTNVSDLVYALDIALESNQELKRSMVDAIGESGVERLRGSIISAKESREFYRNKISFDKLDSFGGTGTQNWFINNIDEVAKSLLENEGFMANNNSIEDLLKKIREVGVRGFYTKESGETVTGFYNYMAPDMYVAGSRYSGTSRPLMNQVMSATNIYKDDMLLMGKSNLPKAFMEGVETPEALMRKLGVKQRVSFLTEQAVDVVNEVSKDGSMIGFATSVKFMSPNEFLERANKIANIEADSELAKRIAVNAKLNDVSVEEIRKAAMSITSSTNIYEDSGAVSPFLARVMSPKTVSKEKFDIDPSNFKVGDMLEPGTILSTADGRVNKYNKQVAKIVGVGDGELFLQLNPDYHDFKIGIGGSEKAVVHTFNAKNQRELQIAQAVFNEISDNANMILNPNLVKHEGFNSLLPAYSNAIIDSITGDDDVKRINQVLKEKMPNHKYELRKINGEFSLIEGERVAGSKFNAIESFEEIINELKSGDTEFAKNLNSRINSIEKNNLGVIDIFTMQDNTIQRGQFEKGIGDGASVSHRSQAVMGSFMGDEDAFNLSKYRDIVDGKTTGLLDPIIKSDIEEMMSDPKFVKAMEQAENTRIALSNSIGMKVDGSKIVESNIKDGLIGGSSISASDIPEIFKMSNEAGRVNAYKVDLGGIKIKNPIYDELAEKGMKIPNEIEEFISEIFVPALDPNSIDDKYVLNEIQKKAADIINNINNINIGNYTERSHDQAVTLLGQQIDDYYKALSYELTDKNGLYKRNLKTKVKYSTRSKVAKVVAPVMEDGDFKDLHFKGKVINVNSDGKLSYTGVIQSSAEDIFGVGQVKSAYKSIGEQLMTTKVSDNEKTLAVLRKTIGTGELDNIKDLDEARKILAKYVGDDKVATKVGETYLKEVGIHSILSRDPRMLSSSDQAVMEQINDSITTGTVAMDTVSAIAINADGDGDEVNKVRKGIFKDKDGNWKLRTDTDEEIIAMQKFIEANSDNKLKVIDEMINSKMAIEATDMSISNYRAEIEKMRKEVFDDNGILNIDYLEGKTRYAAIASRTTKASIGQVSNPNYYLKSASTYYFQDKGFNPAALKAQRNILKFTDITEQGLIDVKSIKSLSDVEDMLNITSLYRKNMDLMGDLSPGSKGKRFNAVREMYSALNKILTENGGTTNVNGAELSNIINSEMFEKAVKEFGYDEAVTQAAQRIMNGSVSVGTGTQSTVEEILSDIMTVLSDKDSNSVFFSPFTRQSDVQYLGSKELTQYERAKRAIGAEGYVEGAKPLEDAIKKAGYGKSGAYIGDRNLNNGDIIYGKNISSNIEGGVFQVTSTERNGRISSITLTDKNNAENIIKVTGENFDDISAQIKDFKVLENVTDNRINAASYGVERAMAKEYRQRFTSSLDEFNTGLDLLESVNQTTLKGKAISRAMDSIDIESTKDMLASAGILSQQGIITNDEASSFIISMNKRIKDEGYANYKQIKKEEMLKIGSIQAKGVSGGQYQRFENQYMSSEAVSQFIDKSKYTSAVKSIENTSRINIDDAKKKASELIDDFILNSDEMNNLDLDTISDIKDRIQRSFIESLEKQDEAAKELLSNVFSKHANNLEFQSEVLKWDLINVKKLLAENKTSEAMDLLNSSKLAYGKYVGMSVSELNSDALKSVLSSEYFDAVKSGIDSSVIQQTKDIIEEVLNLESAGVSRVVSPMNIIDDITEKTGIDIGKEAMIRMNESIKEKASKRTSETTGKMNKKAGKSILDKVKSGLKSIGVTKKGALIGSAIAGATVLGAAYFSGKKEMDTTKGQYVKPVSEDPSNVKQSEPTPQGGRRYTQVPSSDTRFYTNNNTGLNVTVKGKAPAGGSPMHAGEAVSRMFGGTDLKVSTSMSDSRTPIHDREVEQLMSDAAFY